MSVLPLPRPAASSSLLREMLDNPLQFDPPITKAAYTSTAGTVEVTKGPASPPRSVFARQLNGHGQGHAEEDDTTSMPTTTGSSSDGDRSTSPPGALARLISGAKDRHSSLPLTSSKKASSSKSAPQGDVSSAPPTPSRKGKAKEVDTGNTSLSVEQVVNEEAAQSKGETADPSVALSSSAPWPARIATLKRPGYGLHNPLNACYANATLQILLHTPPVLSVALAHEQSNCEYSAV